MQIKRVWNIQSVVVFLCFSLIPLCMVKNLHAALSQSEIEQKMNTACNILEQSLKEPYQGKGSAKVTVWRKNIPSIALSLKQSLTADTELTALLKIDNEKTRDEMFVEFSFKDKASRSDFYKMKDGQKGKWIYSLIYTPENIIRYYPANVTIMSPAAMFREPNECFHPMTISFFDNFIKELKTKIERLNGVFLETTENGLLILKATGNKDAPLAEKAVLHVVLDSNISYRPVQCSSGFIDSKAGMEGSFDYQAKWKQYSSVWYPAWFSFADMESQGNNIDAVRRKEVQILQFDPKTEMKDSVFTLEGLNLPSGTTVNDTRTKTNYKVP